MHAISILAAVTAVASLAAQGVPFPLPASATGLGPVEDTAPFRVPLRMTQTRVCDHDSLNNLGLPDAIYHFDQIAVDPTGRWLFITGEDSTGGSVFRYDQVSHAFIALVLGNESGSRATNPASWNPNNDEFVNMDPVLWTPWNTILAAEETEGGRLFEVTNPLSTNGPFTRAWRSKLPAVIFEGIRIDSAGTLYFSDEDNSGSYYKFVPSVPGNLAVGQTFVLSVDAYAASPSAAPDSNYDSSANRTLPRLGLAHWIPMTNAVGVPLTSTNPYTFGGGTSGGRDAADELVATPYGRAEDMDIGVLANGHEVIYSSLTNENRVLSIELIDASTAFVRDFVNYNTINLATGTDVNPLQNDPYTSPGSGTVFNFPDNLAVDSWGNVYVVEDAVPGDIWKAVDANRDGVAEWMGLFLSLGIGGTSEPSGLIFDPSDPWRCYANILGPSSGNSATWTFTTRPYPGSDVDLELLAGVNRPPVRSPGEFVHKTPPNSTVTMKVQSPNGGLAQSPYVLVVGVFSTSSGVLPMQPPLIWLPSFPLAAISSGLPTPAGSTTVVTVPPGLTGFSALVQAFVVGPSLEFLLTEGHEFVFQ